MNSSIFSLAFSYALRDVSRNRLVFFLTIVSLSVIFTAILLTGGLLEGFGKSLSTTQTDIIGELVIIPKGNETEIKNLSEVEKRLANIGNIDSFSSRQTGFGILKYENRELGPHFVTGVDVESESNVSLLEEKVSSGRFLQSNDRKKIVLGATIADALVDLEYDNKSVEVGDIVTMTSPSGNNWEYDVIGIVDAKTFYTNWATFMTMEESKKFGNFNDIGMIVVRLVDKGKIDETKKIIEEEIPFVEVQTWREQAGFIYDIILVFGLITGSIIGLLSVAVFMVTGVILYINFLQYRRQIGILKSMGTTNLFIVFVYMFEAFIFVTLSFGIAFTIFYYMNMSSNNNPIPLLIGDFHTSLDPLNIFVTFTILLVSSIGGSVVPALIASKTNIVDVIRDA